MTIKKGDIIRYKHNRREEHEVVMTDDEQAVVYDSGELVLLSLEAIEPIDLHPLFDNDGKPVFENWTREDIVAELSGKLKFLSVYHSDDITFRQNKQNSLGSANHLVSDLRIALRFAEELQRRAKANV